MKVKMGLFEFSDNIVRSNEYPWGVYSDKAFKRSIGITYADNYIQFTGGQLVYPTSSDIGSTIDSMSHGDALILSAGSYSLVPSGEDPFRNKNILIVGDTDSAQSVVIDYNADGAEAIRDHPVFSGHTSEASSIYRQLGFVTFMRSNTNSSANYSNSLNKGSSLGNRGVAVNVLFDLEGSYVSWNYDNSNLSIHDCRYIRCTFSNYSSWLNNYSGLSSVIHVGDSIFVKTTTTQYDNLGGNQFDVAVDLQNGTYDTNTYPQSGHLYLPENASQLIN